MERIVGKYYMDDETMLGVDCFPELPQDVNLFYEVIRVIENKPLFLREHYQRFQQSTVHSEGGFGLDYTGFRWAILKLIQKNEMAIGNVKIVHWHKDLKDFYLYYFIPYAYPKPSDYVTGVHVGLLNAERKNPQLKTVQPSVRDTANQLLKEQPWYEVLLVNHFGEITEGSRSNVFFIRKNEIYTPPTSDVLSGITRQKVLQCISELGYSCREQAIKQDDLNNFDAAFITGTSPKVLPIAQIEGIHFQTQIPMLKSILQAYETKIQEDLQRT